MPIDYKDYPENWLTEIRPRILIREEHRCKFCKAFNGIMVFRGMLNGKEVFQYPNERIYTYPEGEYVGSTGLDEYDIQPLKGNPNQKAVKIVLTIAHLDHDEHNHKVKDDRLAALCQKCHLRHDAPEKKRRREAKKKQQSLFPKEQKEQ